MYRFDKKIVFISLLLVCFNAVAQNITNKGREFWVSYGHHQYMEVGTNTQNMVLYLSAEGQAATVTVRMVGSGITPPFDWQRTYNIPANTVIATENIPKGPIDAGPSGSTPTFDARLYDDVPPAGFGGERLFQRRGIQITSNVPIVAYAHIYGSVSSGATMLLPVEAWGYSYTSINSEQVDAGGPGYSWVYAIAKENNTVIQVTPSVITRLGKPAGVPFTVTLQRGEVYQIVGQSNGSGTGNQFTGTTVKSIANPSGQCYPIAVFSGSSRTRGESNPCGAGSGRDNDMQQCYPQQAWGKQYLTAPFSTATGSTLNAGTFMTCVYKVIVKDPTTVVTRNGVPLGGFNGSYYQFSSNTADYIEADKPIMIGQFMSGSSTCNPGSWGDPEMVFLSPIAQAIKRTGFYRNNFEAIAVNYVTVIIPTAGVASLRIDGSNVFNYTGAHPNKPGYSVVVKGWLSAKAQCIMYSDSAFNAITYGLGSAESYAYNAGTYLNNLNAISDLHNELDPTVSSHEFTCVNSPVQLSALVAYQPTQLTWQLSTLAGVLTPSANVTQTPPVSSGTVVVNGITYYKYTLPGTYLFNTAGTYTMSLLATHPTIDNCTHTEELQITYVVKDSPLPDFTFTHTGCTLDTVYFAGQNLAGGGFTLGQWNWQFGPTLTGTGQNPKQVLPPGSYNVTLTGISNEGCVGSIVKPITVHDRPAVTLTATPATVCLGQPIVLSETSSYAGTPGITNWHWDLGDGTLLNNLNGNSVTANYTVPNTYTVQHYVSVSALCKSDTLEQIVVVSPEAKIAFTYPTSCLPASGVAQFGAAATDLGGIPITSYNWNFGDPGSGANNTSTLQNPSHTYTAYNSYAITLQVTTNSGCTGDTTITLAFGPTPQLAYPALAPVCPTASPVNIATATVTNGVAGTGAYTGPGVTGNMFDPVAAGVGTHTITYTHTTPACAETITQTITVLAPPVVSAGTYGPYCVNGIPVTLAGSPAGGTFSGTGVTGTTFSPATAGAGTHTITYNYTDANGCAGTATTTITVNALPVVNAGTYAAACINAATITLAGTPAGGTFTGPGVTGTSFNPATAGAGTHTINYSFTDASGCVGTATTTITVNALPVVNAGTYAAACVNAAAITLGGTPAGGTFSGPGVTGTSFSPVTAGTGTHTITYNYTDANGCANSATTTITVNALPVVNAGTYTSTCLVGAPITLAGTPAGGTFSGPGVTGTTFSPATAGAGTHTITYSYTDANGCTNTATTTITVFALPTANAGTYAPICIDAVAITLAGTPAGGAFTGPGVTGTTFNPATAGTGTHTITYNYTDASGCSASATTTITVNPLPVVSAGTYAAVCGNIASVTLAGTPAGGTFSGPGVTGNTFNPATAGAGTHTITYNYTDANGCANSATTTITVNPLPVVNAGTYAAACIDAAAITLAGTPAGGTFSGPGVTGTTFTPATAGAGTHTITYNYTDANGCAGTATTTITVNALPVVNAGTYTAVCVDAAPVTLTGTPAGGVFSGPGVTGTSLNPATAGVGTHTITYNYTDANGCAGTATTTITVNAIPVLNAGTYPAVCINAPTVTLAGTPTGGTFSGPGVTGTTFNPATAGAGTHTISYGNVAGCNNSTVTTTITVNALPVVNAGTYTGVCSNAAAITLAGTPAGGTFSGPGVTGTTFNPATAGPGTHTITYSYTDANSCTNTATTSIAVNPLPTPAAGVYAPVCIDAAAITLNGTPGGGVFSGPGVTGTTFNPAAAGAGTHTITYNYTNASGCAASSSAAIVVNALPVPAAGNYAPLCAEVAPITLAGTPAGGTFSGPGVTGTTFNPSTAGAGLHTITYSYTNASGCAASSTTNIRVHPTPTSTFTLDNSICQDETSTLQGTGTVSTGTIASWNWNLGNGTTPLFNNNSPFNVSYATHGPYTITLTTISDMGCVSGSTSQTINVHAVPVVSFGLPAGICMPQGSAVFTNATSVADGSALSYSWNFGDASAPSTVAAPTHIYAATGSYNVTLIATSAFGCDAQDMQVLDDFYDRPIASFTADPAELCQGTPNTFTSNSTDPNGAAITGYLWTFGDNTSSSLPNPPKTYSLPGNYTINLVVTNEIGCQSLPYPQSVKVYLQPKIDAGNSFVVPQGTIVQFTAIANSQNLTFSWDPPLGLSNPDTLKPKLTATADQVYTLTATGEFGCTATDFITVKILLPVKIPNVFTPNGDGIHDRWMIPNLADYPSATVEVFNRYGQQVFYIAGYNKPWDGTFKGKDLPVGTYYYVVRLSNGFAPMSGSVTIIR